MITSFRGAKGDSRQSAARIFLDKHTWVFFNCGVAQAWLRAMSRAAACA